MAFNRDSKILVLGHRGLVGSALLRILAAQGYRQVLTVGRDILDLRSQSSTFQFFKETRPEIVVVAAATVGGIVANSSHPYDFIYDNLSISSNVIEACRTNHVEKTLVLGSTCIYPRLATQPIQEESLLTGPLEETNQWYAIAKIAAIKLAQAARRQYGTNIISAMPTNLYGPNDNFELENSHVLPALIREIHDAKEARSSAVTLWGTGRPLREFLHADDLARALLVLLASYDQEEIINIGSAQEISIADLAHLVAQTIGFSGTIHFDSTHPDGTPRKLTDSSKMRSLGWQPTIGLEEGIKEAYQGYLKTLSTSKV